MPEMWSMGVSGLLRDTSGLIWAIRGGAVCGGGGAPLTWKSHQEYRRRLRVVGSGRKAEGVGRLHRRVWVLGLHFLRV